MKLSFKVKTRHDENKSEIHQVIPLIIAISPTNYTGKDKVHYLFPAFAGSAAPDEESPLRFLLEASVSFPGIFRAWTFAS